MGVYIKGINYAECNKCPLNLMAISETCSLNKKNCPLVEVAEPHGRLIDADNLGKSLIDDNRQAFTKHQVWLMFSKYNKNVPTVIEAESEE